MLELEEEEEEEVIFNETKYLIYDSYKVNKTRFHIFFHLDHQHL